MVILKGVLSVRGLVIDLGQVMAQLKEGCLERKKETNLGVMKGHLMDQMMETNLGVMKVKYLESYLVQVREILMDCLKVNQ